MLPSPPLTAESCGTPLPQSLKRARIHDSGDDADTGRDQPPTPPLAKRQRCISLSPIARAQEDGYADFRGFEPTRLLTPPEYAHVPYDPHFGAKVCEQYKQSLRTRRACDAVVSAARRHKYGDEDAEAYSPGMTPDHVRQKYEEKQRRLDEAAADIIANSDSEDDSTADDEHGVVRAQPKCVSVKATAAQSSKIYSAELQCQDISQPVPPIPRARVAARQRKVSDRPLTSIRLILRSARIAKQTCSRKGQAKPSFPSSPVGSLRKIRSSVGVQGRRRCTVQVNGNLGLTTLRRHQSDVPCTSKEFGVAFT